MVAGLLAVSCNPESSDELKSKVSTIDQQVSSIRSSITALESFKTTISDKVSALESDKTASKDDIAALKNQTAWLSANIEDLKSYVDNLNAGTRNWAEATFATLQKMEAIEARLATIEAFLPTVDTKISEAIAALETSIKSWVGVQLADYSKTADMEARVAKAEAAAKTADGTLKQELETEIQTVSSELATLKSEFDSKVKALISAAVAKGGVINDEIAAQVKAAQDALDTNIEDLDSRLSVLESRVAAAEGKITALEEKVADILAGIQSIVAVPDCIDGTVYVPGNVKFEVRPVSAAAALLALDGAKNYFSFQAVKVATKSAESNFKTFTVNSVAMDDAGEFVVADVTTPDESWKSSFQDGSLNLSARLEIEANQNKGNYVCKTSSYFPISSGNFAVTFTGDDPNGTYEVKPELEESAITSGTPVRMASTVALVANPAVGYTLDKWSVTKTDAPSVVVNVTGDAFTMPNYPVTVSATFKAIDYSITCQSTSSNGSFYTMKDNSTVTTANIGNNISVVTTPKSHYCVDKVEWRESGASDWTDITTGKSFTMPATNVEVKVTFGKISGSASATGRGSCTWVKLWEGGPRWANFNVGATIPIYETNPLIYCTENVGGLYRWGGTNNMRDDLTASDDHNTGDYDDSHDTARQIWGDNWKMPSRSQLSDLGAEVRISGTVRGGTSFTGTNTVWTWCDGEAGYGHMQYADGCVLKGWKISGKVGTVYESYSIFLPVAGYFDSTDGTLTEVGTYGCYFSSTEYGSSFAYGLYFEDSRMGVNHYIYHLRANGLSVRAVLAE